MIDPRLSIRAILAALPRYRYRFGSEVEFHEGLVIALNTAGIQFEREHIASARDRFDFYCNSSVVIEAKIKGSFSGAMLQIQRYCELPSVSGVVLAAQRHWARGHRDHYTFHNKPVHVCYVEAQAF